MKNFLASTALALVLASGTAYAANNQGIGSYQAQQGDLGASEFIGHRVYSTQQDVSSNDMVKAGAEKDWDDIGEINEVILGQDGNVKAVVLGVGGFLGIGEKNVAVPMSDVKMVRNGDGANDYYLVVNATKEALNAAPSYKLDNGAMNASNNNGNTNGTQTDMNSTANNALSTTTDTNATTANNNNTQTTGTNGDANTAAATTTDTQTTGSTTNDNAGQSTMDANNNMLMRPNINRQGYVNAEPADLTADRLEGATVYGPNDENVGTINRIVLDDNGKGIKFVVLDVGGFLGLGERHIAVKMDQLNIVRSSNDNNDFRVYVDSDQARLKAQPEYKG